MSNKYFNFYYDPTRQGYSVSVWRTLLGIPTIVNTQLVITPIAKIIHYGDILRGNFTFGVTITAPTAGDSRRFGLIQYKKNAYAYFDITDTVLTARISDGVTSATGVISWQTAWTGVSTEFRIKWEAGSVKFYIAGNLQATLEGNIVSEAFISSVPNDPMSLYLMNSSSSQWLLDYIEAKDIQSYVVVVGTNDTAFSQSASISPSSSVSPSSSRSPSSSASASTSPSSSLSPSVSTSPSASTSPSSSVSWSTSPSNSTSPSSSLSPSSSTSSSTSPSSSRSPSSSTSPSTSLSPSASISPSSSASLSPSPSGPV